MCSRAKAVRDAIDPFLVSDVISLVLEYIDVIPTNWNISLSVNAMVKSSRSLKDRFFVNVDNTIRSLSWCSDGLLFLTVSGEVFKSVDSPHRVTRLFFDAQFICGWKDQIYAIRQAHTSLDTFDNHGTLLKHTPLKNPTDSVVVNENEIFLFRGSCRVHAIDRDTGTFRTFEKHRVSIFARHTEEKLRVFKLPTISAAGRSQFHVSQNHIHICSMKQEGKSTCIVSTNWQNGKTVSTWTIARDLEARVLVQFLGSLVLVCYPFWDHIKVFTLKGEFLEEICHGHFSGARAMHFNGETLFVADSEHDRIHVFR